MNFILVLVIVKNRQKFRHSCWLLFPKKISPSDKKSSQIGEISPHLVTLGFVFVLIVLKSMLEGLSSHRYLRSIGTLPQRASIVDP